KKGQKLNQYSEETKQRAIQLKLQGKTYREIMKELDIYDPGRIKVWMRKYKELGELGLLDQRGRKEEYVDQNRYVEKLERENAFLKKCLEIWMQEVQHRNMQLLGN
ncbi:helix-turn-helix domain-containing protein, partial [Paenibacillus sp. CCS19]|uniref:helix-turn-helix domain-containing protein n=1 Tax=Paenibacillus sp. CCS19 TaxID=3158387 RepID=UPI00295EAC4B